MWPSWTHIHLTCMHHITQYTCTIYTPTLHAFTSTPHSYKLAYTSHIHTYMHLYIHMQTHTTQNTCINNTHIFTYALSLTHTLIHICTDFHGLAVMLPCPGWRVYHCIHSLLPPPEALSSSTVLSLPLAGPAAPAGSVSHNYPCDHHAWQPVPSF